MRPMAPTPSTMEPDTVLFKDSIDTLMIGVAPAQWRYPSVRVLLLVYGCLAFGYSAQCLRELNALRSGESRAAALDDAAYALWASMAAGMTLSLLSAVQPLWRKVVGFRTRHTILSAAQRGFGIVITCNFLLFWAIAVYGQGQSWKWGVGRWLRWPYDRIDQSTKLRAFTSRYIFGQQKFADYSAVALLTIGSLVGTFSLVCWWQLTFGSLPWWLVYGYYFAWVGFGGRGMATAYTLAHKEGHCATFYQPWIRRRVGNVFENWVALLYGSVPYIFSTSHIRIHHRLNGSQGDTIYQWDLDRTSLWDFMIYLYRMALHTSGVSSLAIFRRANDYKRYQLLLKGCLTFWVMAPAAIMMVFNSWSFLFWIYLQPWICMTYFLSFVNYAQHGFLELDALGAPIKCVASMTIVNGQDDSFGEDDHIAHHYSTATYYRDLQEYQTSQAELWAKHHASVFTDCAIIEVSAWLLLKQFDLMAQHYVQFAAPGSADYLSREQVVELLKTRAARKELSHYDYELLCEQESAVKLI